MHHPNHPEIWFVTGSQSLYGEAILQQVAADSTEMAGALDHAPQIPLRVVHRPVLTSPEAIRALCQEANSTPHCAGLILWMHTFSPAKMWIGGLMQLRKPFVHFHTQFHRHIPWATIDMDYMNLHQSAHGDREAGFLHTRLRLARKVVVGHWKDPETLDRLGAWSRAALAWQDWQGARFVRFGDNMRQVAVTEGDKVSAEMCFGFSVNGHGVGDLVQHVHAVEETAVDALTAEYEECYEIARELRRQGARYESLREGARIELGLRSFLSSGNFKGFTTTLNGLVSRCSSPRVQGRVIGLMQSAGSLGRFVGPLIAMALVKWDTPSYYGRAPFWGGAIFSLIACFLVLTFSKEKIRLMSS